MAFDYSSGGYIAVEATSTTNATSQWWTATKLVGTPTRGLALTLNLLYAATSAALGTANVIIQASDDGTANVRTVGQYLQKITDATSTATATGLSSEQTINVSSPRQGYLRAILQLTGANPGHTAIWSVRISSANPA